MKKVFNHLDHDWQNINVPQRNRLSPRPFYTGYRKEKDALTGRKETSGNYQLLNGQWDFEFFESPFDLPEHIADKNYRSADMKPTPVPSHWQFHGYGHPHYVDDFALTPVQDIPLVPHQNPTGVYRRTIQLSKGENTQYILRFDGVESAFHVYVNGTLAGYSQVSHNTSEFEISSYLESGDNLLTVVVYQYHEGSVLEIQDMWTLAGIMRDVTLIARPQIHFDDYTLLAGLTHNYTDGTLDLEISTTNDSSQKKEFSITVDVLDGSQKICTIEKSSSVVAGKKKSVMIKDELPDVSSWTAETPYLYGLLITLKVEGLEPQYHYQRFGFRTVEIKNGLMLVNGHYIKLRGMNRHDWSGDSGRAVTVEDMRRDICLMKEFNVNAVRTAHYPNMPIFYELCDELGLYVMSEADIECNEFIHIKDKAFYSQSTQWTASYLDRVERMVRRDKNATSIIMWSLGNESSYGQNFKVCYDFCHSYDPSRLVHYEEDRQALSTDVYSTMYTNHADLEALGKRTDLGKPHILCEYSHAMGNSPGGLDDYWQIINRYPRLQGAFLWEWIAHGIKGVDENGTEYFRYGGDFGDRPTTGKFCTSGIISPARVPYPGTVQLKKAMEPIKMSVNFKRSTLTVENLFNFISLDDYTLLCTVDDAGKEIDQFTIDLSGIPPMSKKQISLTGLKKRYSTSSDKAILTCICLYKNTPAWSKGRTVLTTSQFQLPSSMVDRKPLPSRPLKGAVNVNHHRYQLSVEAGGATYLFDTSAGELIGLSHNGKEILKEPMELCFWRAPIDNDRKEEMVWKEFLVNTLLNNVLSTQIDESKDKFTFVSKKIFAPFTKDWRIDATMTYTVTANGLHVECKGTPTGELPRTLPRIGLSFAVDKAFTHAQWLGHGPGPSYVDAYLGNPFGRYEKSIDDMYVPYVFPQEHASRSGVDELTLKGTKETMKITMEQPLLFSASYYSTKTLDKALHTNELVKSDKVHVHLDYKQHGLGSASWGPDALDYATLHPQPFQFAFHMTLGKP